MNWKMWFAVMALPVMTGCLSSAPQTPTCWTIDFSRASADAVCAGDVSTNRVDVRVTSLSVRSPYAGQRLAVLRADGSVAFDPFNAFAASPSLLLRGAAIDVVRASGRFRQVVTDDSAARVPHALEITVTELALDCRTAGTRTARVAVDVMLLDGRDIAQHVRGAGETPAEGDYSAAFSASFVKALGAALGAIAAP